MLTRLLAYAGLSNLAVGLPAADLLRRNPDFFAVHDAGRLEAALLAVVLFVGVPAAAALVMGLAALAGRRAGAAAHGAMIAIMAALALLPALGGVTGLPPAVAVGLAVAAGVGIAAALVRRPQVEPLAAWTAAAVPVMATLLVMSAPQRPSPPPAVANGGGLGADAPPVVVVIFDEFPGFTLLQPDGSLDADLFPNFARLAEQATWFPNATSISPATLRSVPAILGGVFPRWDENDNAAAGRNNLFTLLGPTHRVLALEAQTRLCPPELQADGAPQADRSFATLLDDVAILYQHTVVPPAWRGRLVPVTYRWANFREALAETEEDLRPDDRMARFRDIVARVQEGDRPPLFMAHILLPHTPWRFHPNGKVASLGAREPVGADERWGDDPWVVGHALRRFLLQAMAVDRLLGELLDRLDEQGLLESAAIVVTSDHGANFRPGSSRRVFDGANAAAIMGVPLFIKAPRQDEGRIDRRHVQTIDILPTLAGLIGADLPWATDGRDVLADPAFDRQALDFFDQDARERRSFPVAMLSERDDLVAWKTSLTGTAGGEERLFAVGDRFGLMGAPVSGREPVREDLKVRIDQAPLLADVDTGAEYVPGSITGRLLRPAAGERAWLALAVNGRIAAVSPTYLAPTGATERSWRFAIDTGRLRDGPNETAVYLVEETGAGVNLARIPREVRSFLGVNLAASAVSGVGEEGLFGQHDWKGTPARWTNGRGVLEIPLLPGEQPECLDVGIMSSGPKGAFIAVAVNGVELLRQRLRPGPWSVSLPLDGVQAEDVLRIEVTSSTFVPAAIDANSSDRRSLGVALSTLLVR
jgi:hypothetical protein